MRDKKLVWLSLLLAVTFSAHASIAGAAAPPALPEGDTGIAAAYPADVNIRSNAHVLFADDFESYTSLSQLTASGNYTNSSQVSGLSFAPPTFFGGAKSQTTPEPATTT